MANRFRAIASSLAGVFCDFLMNTCRMMILRSTTVQKNALPMPSLPFARI